MHTSAMSMQVDFSSDPYVPHNSKLNYTWDKVGFLRGQTKLEKIIF